MSGPTFELNSAPIFNDTLVRAGAGAGKTHGLIQHVVDLYQTFKRQTGAAPRIVLTTFTRKATQELKERLILRACEEQNSELLQFVSDPSHLQISTIHGLFSHFLRRMGHLSGLDSGFQIVSDAEAVHLARLALRETLLENPEGLAWLETYGFERSLKMLRQFDRLSRERGQLEPAQREDLLAAAKLEGDNWRQEIEQWAQWVESFTEDGKWRNYATELRHFTQSWPNGVPSAEGLPKKPNRSAKLPEFDDLHEKLQRPLDRFRRKMDEGAWHQETWPEMITQWETFASVARDFQERMAALKAKQGRFEMIDLELKTLEMLRAQPVLGEVFGAEWDYWMIDEYQDTSPLQVEVLEAIIAQKPRYVVGDPQQSIYLFRGADVEVFRRAQGEITAKGGGVVELTRNYRSVPELLLWINQFTSTLGGDFMQMQPRQEPQGEATFGREPRVLMVRAPDALNELTSLVSRVGQLMAAGARLEDICVLGRTRRGLVEASRALRAHGYPTHVHAASGFATRREVLDAQAVWKFLVNPHDNLNLLQLLRSPWFLVEDWLIADWMKSRPQSLWRRLLSLETPCEPIERLKSCAEQVKSHGLTWTFEHVLNDQGLLDLSLQNDPAGRKESNLWKMIDRARQLEREGGQSLTSLLEAESGDDATESQEGDAASAQEPGAINLMTIHGSKGLQFEHVLLAGMGQAPQTSNTAELSERGQKFFFPAWCESAAEFVASPLDVVSVREIRQRELAEFDRWLYVALTRAKETLTLLWSEPARESWAERSPWFQRPVGEWTVEGCRVKLVEQMPEPLGFQLRQNRDVQVRDPYAMVAAEKGARQSVTDWVSRQNRPTRSDGAGHNEDLIRRWQAQAVGSSVHRALEALKFGGIDSLGKIEDESVRFVMELEDPPIREWIAHGKTEWGFQVLTKRGVVEGQIDLWAKWKDRLYVVDYKSGSPAYQEQAFQQLSLYAWALNKFGHHEPGELLVIYPHLKKVVRRPITNESLHAIEAEFGGS